MTRKRNALFIILRNNHLLMLFVQ